MELGAGFAFVERQKRIVVDGEDFYLDLLFYHRRLRRLVLVELKLGKFQAADYGQTQLYLRWLDRHERQPGEECWRRSVRVPFPRADQRQAANNGWRHWRALAGGSLIDKPPRSPAQGFASPS